jgi:hypothetical protein
MISSEHLDELEELKLILQHYALLWGGDASKTGVDAEALLGLVWATRNLGSG